MLNTNYQTEFSDPAVMAVTQRAWWEQLIDLGREAIVRALPVERAPSGAPGIPGYIPNPATVLPANMMASAMPQWIWILLGGVAFLAIGRAIVR